MPPAAGRQLPIPFFPLEKISVIVKCYEHKAQEDNKYPHTHHLVLSSKPCCRTSCVKKREDSATPCSLLLSSWRRKLGPHPCFHARLYATATEVCIHKHASVFRICELHTEVLCRTHHLQLAVFELSVLECSLESLQLLYSISFYTKIHLSISGFKDTHDVPKFCCSTQCKHGSGAGHVPTSA